MEYWRPSSFYGDRTYHSKRTWTSNRSVELHTKCLLKGRISRHFPEKTSLWRKKNSIFHWFEQKLLVFDEKNNNNNNVWNNNSPNHDACAAVMCNVSSGFNSELIPVNDGITIAVNASEKPRLMYNKFRAKLAINCGEYRRIVDTLCTIIV